MRWIYNPTRITTDGYLTFGNGRDQGGNLKNKFFAYSPAITFPAISNISTDEHGHFSRKQIISASIKLTIYDSFGQKSFGNCIINYIPRWVTSVNLQDANLSSNTGFPATSGTYYFQFLASDIVRFLNNEGVIQDNTGATLTADNLYCYPIYMEFVCNTMGYKNSADIITTRISTTSATYNAGYYYIPFTRPDTGTSYSSVRVRAAIVPDCPHSIVEMVSYKNNIVYTASTDMNATTGSINNLIYNIPSNETRYIKLSYTEIKNMIEILDGICPDKIDADGVAIQVQWFWYHDTNVEECLGDYGDKHSLRTKDSSGYEYKHDISLYRGTIPVHKTNRPKLNIDWIRYCEAKDLHVTWDIDGMDDWGVCDYDCMIGLSIVNTTYNARTLKYLDPRTEKERRARGRIRPREYVVWIDPIDMYDCEWTFSDIHREIRWHLHKKLRFFYDNVDDAYVYVRPVIGYYRRDCDNGNGGYHWLRASDEYIRVDIY